MRFTRTISIAAAVLLLSGSWAAIPANTERMAFLYSVSEDSQPSVQDSLSQSGSVSENYRYPGRAMLFSGLIPGLGELYSGNIRRALLFAGVEIGAWLVWHQYDNKGDDETIAYEQYADEHWEFTKWIEDFYHWKLLPNEDGNPEWMYHLVFSDENESYASIYEGSHYIGFLYDDPEDSQQKSGTTNDEELFWDEMFSGKEADEIQQTMIDYHIQVLKDHNYYENIGKYNHFFAGWMDETEPFDDNNSNGVWDPGEPFTDETGDGEFDDKYFYITSNGGYDVAQNSYKDEYTDMRKQANDYKQIASYAISAVMFNHVASAIDAVFTTRAWNNKNTDVNLSARPLYDPENKYGLGGFEVSLEW